MGWHCELAQGRFWFLKTSAIFRTVRHQIRVKEHVVWYNGNPDCKTHLL